MKFILFIGCALGTLVSNSYGSNKSVDVINTPKDDGPYIDEMNVTVTEEEFDHSEETENEQPRLKRQISAAAGKWTNGTVYYFFDPSLNEDRRKMILRAHEYIRSRTCLDFVENSTAPNRVKVFSGSGCSAGVGMKGGEQQLSYSCGNYIHNALHETMHGLGVWHMQQRGDRDQYLNMNKTYGDDSNDPNYSKIKPHNVLNYTPYDFGSIMHYPANSRHVPWDERYLDTLGGEQITFYDIDMLNIHYGCHQKCNSSSNAAKCENGGVPNPRNCSVCLCPSGYGGALCNQRPSGCGKTFTATEDWEYRPLMISGSEKVEDIYHCTHWISAPTGKQIEVVIKYMPLVKCDCAIRAIEIKTDKDTRITNPRTCCTESPATVYKSALNPTPIISYDIYKPNIIGVIMYRYVDAPTTTTSVKPTTTTATSTTTTPSMTTSILPLNVTSEN